MDWQARYRHKLGSPQSAIKAIAPGTRILIGSGAAEPSFLVQALVEHGAHLAGNEIVHLLTLGPAPYVQPEMRERFRHVAFFIGKNVRDAVHDGRADFMPVFLSEIPELIRSRRIQIDVALIQVSPPDAFGYASLGTSVDIVRAAVDSADMVIAQVNANMPRTLGDSFIEVERIAHLLPRDEPLPELAPEPPDAAALEIGRHVASLIPDGATLQMGIGSIPDAVLAHLGKHSDLGVHTEMFSDGAMELARAGIINGRRKTLLRGKMVTSFVMGSKKLYDWVNDNPQVEFRPSEFTNDPAVIARNEDMIAINSALAVDLTGQVAADTLMGRFFSGIGGQVDFIRGSARSARGKPIIALRSTAKKGTVSRIQPAFEEGAGVVTSRGDVHYVVTEYGYADLWGKNIRQRALSLIEIAHPDFRSELLDSAKKRHYVFADQLAPRAPYPWEQARTEALPDGTRVIVRPARLTDEEALQRIFHGLDESTSYRQAFGIKRVSHAELQKLVDLDYEQTMAFVAAVPERQHDLVAMAEYRLDPATRLASVGFAVRHDWQLKGLGTLLMSRLVEVARARGVAGLQADVPRGNLPMIAIFQKCGLVTKSHLSEDGTAVHITAIFGASSEAPPSTSPKRGEACRPDGGNQ